MKLNRNEAKALTNAKELELYDMARAPRLNKLTVKELENLVKRSRTLRDKLTDVKRNQVRSKQATAKARGAAPADRSKEKAALFGEVHDVFVAQLAKVEAGELKAKAKPSTKKPTKADKNIETRSDRTGVRQKLKAVKKTANTGPTGAPAKKAASSKNSEKKPLASAARVSKASPAKNKGKDRSAKATFASKSAVNSERTVLETPQAAARKPDPTGKVEIERIARSGMTRQRGHLSSQNKRKQGRRDSK